MTTDRTRRGDGQRAEVPGFIQLHALYGLGIGYVDAHLLVSARLSGALLWTHDKRLKAAAIRLGLADGNLLVH